MRFRVVRIEMRGDDEVAVYLKSTRSSPLPKPDVKNPVSFVEFGLKLGEEAVKRMEYDAFVTMSYEEYAALDFKVGDYVDVDIRLAER
ncbi:MAG: hypothetical protein ABWW66_03470 [Archaeoglobaceae archaeon]